MKVNHQFALGALSTYISSVKAVVAATGEGKFKVDMKAEAGKAITAASHTTAGKAITAASDSAGKAITAASDSAGKAITAASDTTAGKAITAAIDSLPSEVEEAVKKYA